MKQVISTVPPSSFWIMPAQWPPTSKICDDYPPSFITSSPIFIPLEATTASPVYWRPSPPPAPGSCHGVMYLYLSLSLCFVILVACHANSSFIPGRSALESKAHHCKVLRYMRKQEVNKWRVQVLRKIYWVVVHKQKQWEESITHEGDKDETLLIIIHIWKTWCQMWQYA